VYGLMRRMASVVDGRSNEAGELKKIGQRLLIIHTGTPSPCAGTHTVVWLGAEHSADQRSPLVVYEKSGSPHAANNNEHYSPSLSPMKNQKFHNSF